MSSLTPPSAQLTENHHDTDQQGTRHHRERVRADLAGLQLAGLRRQSARTCRPAGRPPPSMIRVVGGHRGCGPATMVGCTTRVSLTASPNRSLRPDDRQRVDRGRRDDGDRVACRRATRTARPRRPRRPSWPSRSAWVPATPRGHGYRRPARASPGSSRSSASRRDHARTHQHDQAGRHRSSATRAGGRPSCQRFSPRKVISISRVM